MARVGARRLATGCMRTYFKRADPRGSATWLQVRARTEGEGWIGVDKAALWRRVRILRHSRRRPGVALLRPRSSTDSHPPEMQSRIPQTSREWLCVRSR